MSLSLAGFDHRLLNFAANCNISGQYFATPHVGGNETLTTEYFRQALPAEYRDNFTFADIGNYILPPGSSRRWIEEAEGHAKGVCWYEICDWAYKDFRGSPDITGVGVSSAIPLKVLPALLLTTLIGTGFLCHPMLPFHGIQLRKLHLQ